MVTQIKSYDFQPRVTLWIHPFVNMICSTTWTEAAYKGYFIHDAKNIPPKDGFPDKLPGNTYWWQGAMAGYIDFTNPEAVEWWKVFLLMILHNFRDLFQLFKFP